MGVRIARKHINWYLTNIDTALLPTIKKAYAIDSPEQQLAFIDKVFYALKNNITIAA